MTILSVDPGETVGFAVFTETGKALKMAEVSSEEFLERLAGYKHGKAGKLTRVIVEDFRLQQGKQMAQTGSKFEAVQVIGECRLFAKEHDLGFFRQSPQILRVTAKHMRISLPDGHIADHTSALLHGYRRLIEEGFETAVLRALNGLD